jgi:hypothetical protein
MRSSMYESFGPTMRERGCSPSGTSASILLHDNNQEFMSEPHLALKLDWEETDALEVGSSIYKLADSSETVLAHEIVPCVASNA